jgi:hypothetical protein
MRGIAQLAAVLLAMGGSTLAPAAQARVGASADYVKCSRSASPVWNGRAVSVTGVWAGNDGGTYWVRQIGSCVYWAGFSAPADSPSMGRSFSNVFAGWLSTSSGVHVYGYWADVPRGATASGGVIRVEVQVDSLGRGVAMNKLSSSGGFGGTNWKRIS